MTTFKKILGAAVSALLVSAPVAATAAQPVRPTASLVKSKATPIKSGIRAGTAKKGESAATTGGYVLGAAAAGLFIWGLIEILDDGDDSPE